MELYWFLSFITRVNFVCSLFVYMQLLYFIMRVVLYKGDVSFWRWGDSLKSILFQQQRCWLWIWTSYIKCRNSYWSFTGNCNEVWSQGILRCLSCKRKFSLAYLHISNLRAPSYFFFPFLPFLNGNLQVEFRPALVASTELQFYVEVLSILWLATS